MVCPDDLESERLFNSLPLSSIGITPTPLGATFIQLEIPFDSLSDVTSEQRFTEKISNFHPDMINPFHTNAVRRYTSITNNDALPSEKARGHFKK